ncbi:hypothetical protein HETIRDRAFT_441944 [Heterobasidion irregulare TC 32-1]|uniref:Uncharacterized protein n=1 Tax=Heterobasidion irregulare (strain TC 32-1) TaxID=747525 RepID=W4JSA7_HETIT|nr:uncharacterized protein HETIRDRAFT_441944 [Heterobasidion irregulare TC 32-1]ETW76329.1 hypothetical protein HETIRDRAFT_441944 [Heterobasidion irregulare TC 32-1]
MLKFSDNTVEGRKTLMADLTLKQKELERQATRQSDQILALIERDQQQFRTAIDARLAKFTSVIQTVYPAITSSAPASIQMITDAHVADVSAARSDQYSDALFEATVATGSGVRINDLM